MNKPVKLVLVDDLERDVLEEVVRRVPGALGLAVSLSKSPHCEGGFDPTRNQWLADKMVEHCVKSYASSDCYAVGLTGKDLYTPGLNFVFGLALREKGTGIVSWNRLGRESQSFVMRIVKEVIHEVGHLEGLVHCPNQYCVMWFSNNLSETDRKSAEFCHACEMKRAARG